MKGGFKGKENESDADSSDGSLGNVPLRLWVCERFLGMLPFFYVVQC